MVFVVVTVRLTGGALACCRGAAGGGVCAFAAGTPDAALSAVASCCPTFAHPLIATATHRPARPAFVLSKRLLNMFGSCFCWHRLSCVASKAPVPATR